MSTQTNTTSVVNPLRPTEGSDRNHSLKRTESRWGWILISPWIIGFFGFIFLPMIASLVFTFTDFSLNNPDDIQFIGLDNYRQLTTDPILSKSLEVTFLYMAIALPLSIILPLALAIMMNAKLLWGKSIFRTLFYMPYIVPVISVVGIWNGYLNTNSGWLNRMLDAVGVSGPDWLNSETWIYPALIIIGIWGLGNAMLIMLAGLQGVPTELYEAAKVDGAGPLSRIRHVTLPMVSPVIFYNLILSVIGLFRYFEIPYIMKNGTGDPGNATMFFNIHFYKTAFTFQDMGYGATLAWLLFVIAMSVTIGLFWSARYWVYYAAGD